MKTDRGVVLTLAVVVLTAGLAAGATQGLIFAAVAVALALYVVVAITIGAQKTGIACMMAAFLCAPMYRGLEQLVGGIPPTDVFIIVGIIHLLPSFLGKRLKLPTVYLVGLLLMAVFSLISVMVTGDLFTNAFYAVQWLFFIGALPIVMAWWGPDRKIVDLLLWSYLVGHLISTAKGVTEGAVYAGRYDGLTHHPNAFGLAGVTAIVMVLFLVGHHKDALSRLFLAGFVGVSLLSVTMSGSRAAIVVLVVVILLVPIVERSAMIGFAFAICAALGVVALPFIVDISGEESAIGRLAGSGTATASDEVRNEAFDYGLDRLWSSPIFGTGFSDVEQIHNVFLEAAVAIGLLGLVSYLIVLFALARPLFTQHPMRRLTYMIWVFIGVAPTFPGLWDRTVWVPASVAALAMIAPRTTNAPADPEVGPARADGAGSVSPGRA